MFFTLSGGGGISTRRRAMHTASQTFSATIFGR
jgi:hypothetical protein